MSDSQPSRPMIEQEAQSLWEPPVMTFLGDVRLLVRGHGKVGSNSDADPQHTRKSGVG